MDSLGFNRFALIAFAVALAGGAGEVRAEDASGTGRFAVEGPGNLDCNAFIKARQDRSSPEYQRFIGYAEGYLSAANRYEPRTFDLSPWHNATAFDLIITGHCEDHGTDLFANVLQLMVSSFRPLRIAKFSPLLEVGDGQYKALVYEAILKRSQAALSQLGYYAGPENAQFTPELRESFLRFQRDRELVETGIPDAVTLWTLLNP